ncbi:urokinase plasminogen activator surface receptor-like isoform X1 [Garra rufa]|uniref:urokinase plasminogen activator surface receptor-like isoform X1 n=1 Tax=Garra rufa TaxID=137080 RepID=UPI003CCEEC18
MDLQISVFVLFLFFTAGHSRYCYDCTNTTDSCAKPLVTTCPDQHSCYSLTSVGQYGNIPATLKYKGCISPFGCVNGSTNFNSNNVSYFCCSTDFCNKKDAPDPIGNSGLNVPSVIQITTVFNDSNTSSTPNGKRCHYCVWQNCSKIMNCTGEEDHCFDAKGTFGRMLFNLKGCVTKADCDAATSSPHIKSISCCEGDLCNSPNSANSVTQSFLFLCCSLLSFILLH